MAGPDAGSASSGEKTLRSVTQTEASMDTSADISKTPPALEPREIQPLEIDLMMSSDIETQPTVSKHHHISGYHGSHAGSGTGATADAFSIPSHDIIISPPSVSYTHLTLPTNREV